MFEHMCWKHVEAWNKLTKKFSASGWLILINKYIEMYGQQNIKKKKYYSVKFVVRFCIYTNVQFFQLHVLSVYIYCEDIL